LKKKTERKKINKKMPFAEIETEEWKTELLTA